MATESVENRPEEVHMDVNRVSKEAKLLIGDNLLKEGDWRGALHTYLKEGSREKLIDTALKFKEEGKEDEYNIALGYIDLLERRNRPSEGLDM